MLANSRNNPQLPKRASTHGLSYRPCFRTTGAGTYRSRMAVGRLRPPGQPHIRRDDSEDHGAPGRPEETFVLFEGDIPVATASLARHDLDSRPDLTPWLAGVFVEPAFRQRGYAIVLVRYVEARAMVASVPTLWLNTWTAEPLYAERTQYCSVRDELPGWPPRHGTIQVVQARPGGSRTPVQQSWPNLALALVGSVWDWRSVTARKWC